LIAVDGVVWVSISVLQLVRSLVGLVCGGLGWPALAEGLSSGREIRTWVRVRFGGVSIRLHGDISGFQGFEKSVFRRF